ncbi:MULTISPECIES: RagB/SusD family nutrient uptake outer membrane protein [Mesonia]|uniref:SusD-like protein n=1 Tax=Mesonia oceanica TaxID=2687242 RepID=A0AC61YAY4_9FLAO|nr:MULTISPECIES: RagB/SusD family nutrient uptake outer membrane protein [Mesonia]MAN26716.1 RagB/SusD family nutrient uptake outer membrane protein [Mesonia sp.]MAQ39834.1 RagB/SusD family nutrient uptake outer membrane protein [Mesonia sp.]MBJ96692.1 RagB/SusD family nutrient uptake outer membrane protein [Flavobacteriaceae bacterium]VVV01390.1 SusD-like protein [Mesonia oceanica]
MKLIRITQYTLALAFIFQSLSCSDDYLEETTYGEVAPAEMTNPENVERAIISAYSVLNGQFDTASNAFNSPDSNWSFGDVVSDDAYKGGGGTGDQNNIHQMEIFNTNPTIIDVERKWMALYEGVKRCNEALKLLKASEAFDANLKVQRLAELHFLRGHYYFELKKIYNHIPYIDESAITVEDYARSNTEFTSEELWAKIEANFQTAYEGLPETQSEAGRPTKIAAKAYLTKCYLFQKKWQQAFDASTEVMESNYGLLDDFQEVFLPENDNSKEIIFAVQHTINDGQASNYNGSIGDRLSAPGGPFYAQYGFHRPSQNLVNAYKTNTNGLPVANNNTDLSDEDLIDPRLDITVGRPGIPYKDLGILYEESWARDLATYGPYGPKKRIVSANSAFYVKVWPYVNALNYYIIRYAEVVLWRAEAAVELNNLEESRQLVNQIRGRAANTATVKKLEGTEDAANYNIATYESVWTDQELAREAVHLETRLELAMEGHRFFNLVRWGKASSVINSYLEVEKTRRSHLMNAQFKAGTNEYWPIPQRYIDGTPKDLVTQNTGY